MNKTVCTALFIIIVSGINSVWGEGGGLTVVSADRMLGGPASGITDGAPMVHIGRRYDYDEEKKHGEIIVHNASLVTVGQSSAMMLTGAAEAMVENFSIPARGINWGTLHSRNAIDIAGRCGAPLYAASAGQVQEVRAADWNGGYGNYVDVHHGDGIVTRYAHTGKIIVVEGQMVAPGEMIAVMGNTGESTGCHVHFEVRGETGARNPFAKK